MDTHIAALADPERHFVGCLLCLPLEAARRVLSGMGAAEMADPAASEALQLVIEVVAAGQPPAPVATGRAPGETHRARLGRWLVDTYGAVTAPALADHLKTMVLERAWRRAIANHATRLLHAADHSPTDVLAALADDHQYADHLWERYDTARRTPPSTDRWEKAA